MDARSYRPRATFDLDLTGGITWEDVIGVRVGQIGSTSWAEKIEAFIEKDLFDVSWVPQLVERSISNRGNPGVVDSLVFLACTSMF